MQVECIEHFAILSTYVKLPLVIKIFVLSIFEWPLYKGFTAYQKFGLELHLRVCTSQRLMRLCQYTDSLSLGFSWILKVPQLYELAQVHHIFILLIGVPPITQVKRVTFKGGNHMW